MRIEAKTLTLVLCSPEEARAQVDALPPEMRREVSPEWLKRIEESTEADPWLHGFTMVHRETGATVGSAGFKAPPDAEGCVEIAYGVEPEHRGKGYAKEAAAALTGYALESDKVRAVRAHTLPKPSASTRVLTKCGFQLIGEVTDPEDGLVWRWEVRRE
jgi:[ribosomal protein S5]-alanine N-acetyltransferase